MVFKPEILIEASLFSAGKPLSKGELSEALGLSKAEIEKHLSKLKSSYSRKESALEIAKVGKKYIMQIKSELADYVKSLAPMQIPQKVLKTAALIAYHQPIKQSELSEMYGAKVYDHVGVLHDLGLVRKRSEGRTVVLTTTAQFAEYFGIDSTDREKIKHWLADKLKKGKQ
jgi:segregation and condensation protein B